MQVPMDVNTTPSAPYVTYALKVDGVPEKRSPKKTLYIAVTSYAETPITVFSYRNILDGKSCFYAGKFVLINEAGRQVKLFQRLREKSAYQHYKGSSDDQHHFTLEPGIPVVRSFEFRPPLRQGRTYKLALKDGAGFSWWCWGTREDVLRNRHEPQPESMSPPIVLVPWEPMSSCLLER